MPATAVRHLRHSVGEIFRTIYSRPAGTKTARQVADGLHRCARRLDRMIVGYDDLSEQGRSAIEVAAALASQQLSVISETLQFLRELAENLPEVATTIAQDR